VLQPLLFHPIYKERVWGGREIEALYGRKLPPGKAIGESWEISDRPGDESVIANGEFAGRSLRWLMEHHAGELLGDARPAAAGRFPLLCKILDAREKLSLQVHPPPGRTGEPKTELWYIAGASRGAEIYAGLRKGTSRAAFERKISDGSVADCFHRIPVRAGDAIHLPSGRAHALGGGLVIFEIQQNSDTTYRVFDWNRAGLDGKPRELHVAQSLACIDFDDFEPELAGRKFAAGGKIRSLVKGPLFDIEQWRLAQQSLPLKPLKLQIVALISGQVEIKTGPVKMKLSAGQFCLIPANLERVEIIAGAEAELLRIEAK
jgi:mannose-6-phosphate isomerase